jgi:hypothetical protein
MVDFPLTLTREVLGPKFENCTAGFDGWNTGMHVQSCQWSPRSFTLTCPFLGMLFDYMITVASMAT